MHTTGLVTAITMTLEAEGVWPAEPTGTRTAARAPDPVPRAPASVERSLADELGPLAGIPDSVPELAAPAEIPELTSTALLEDHEFDAAWDRFVSLPMEAADGAEEILRA